MTQKKSPERGHAPGLTTTTTTASISVPRPAPSPERELLAWQCAVEHLHAYGLPAAVPSFPAAWLRRRGVYPDWETAA